MRAVRVFPGKAGGKVICRDCLDSLRPDRSPHCPVCGRFFDGAGGPHVCGPCLNRTPPFTRHRSYAKYAAQAKDVVLLFKYRGHEPLGRALAGLIDRELGLEEDLWNGVEAVVPVPLHPGKLRRRGYNQAAVLARHLAKLRGLPFVGNRLLKTRNNPAQMSLDAAEREANVRGAYLVKKPGPLDGRVVLLVDDVFTTGATVAECSRVLLQAGAVEVRAITFARA